MKEKMDTVRNFKTCEEYKIYMEGNPDDVKDKRNNPVPQNAMSLKELGGKSKEELLGIVNQVGAMESKSDIRNMYAKGYGFTWGELETVAKYAGFYKDSENKRSVHYSLEGVKEVFPEKEVEEDLQKEILREAKKRENVDRQSIFLFKEDYQMFKELVEKYTVFGIGRIGQAVIFRKMVRKIMK